MIVLSFQVTVVHFRYPKFKMVLALEIIGTLSVALLIWKLFTEFSNGGLRAVLAWVTHFIGSLPGIDGMLKSYVRNEVVGFVGQLYKGDGIERSVKVSIPEVGKTAGKLVTNKLCPVDVKCLNSHNKFTDRSVLK